MAIKRIWNNEVIDGRKVHVQYMCEGCLDVFADDCERDRADCTVLKTEPAKETHRCAWDSFSMYEDDHDEPNAKIRVTWVCDFEDCMDKEHPCDHEPHE